jgi:hypothetical protein
VARPRHDLGEHIALVEILDRVLGKGAIIAGEITIAVADVDLIKLELQLALGSVDSLLPPALSVRRRNSEVKR